MMCRICATPFECKRNPDEELCVACRMKERQRERFLRFANASPFPTTILATRIPPRRP